MKVNFGPFSVVNGGFFRRLSDVENTEALAV
jgi:hypothetical protein